MGVSLTVGSNLDTWYNIKILTFSYVICFLELEFISEIGWALTLGIYFLWTCFYIFFRIVSMGDVLNFQDQGLSKMPILQNVSDKGVNFDNNNLTSIEYQASLTHILQVLTTWMISCVKLKHVLTLFAWIITHLSFVDEIYREDISSRFSSNSGLVG